MHDKNPLDVFVSRSPGGSLAIDIHKSQLPPTFEGKKLALSGPTILPNGEMVLIITVRRKEKGLAPVFAVNTRHVSQKDRLITRFSVRRNQALMAQLPFGMTACSMSANNGRMEITVPPERTKAIYKNEYKSLDPDRITVSSDHKPTLRVEPDWLESTAEDLYTDSQRLFAAIDTVNQLKGPNDKLFISEEGKLGVELITRYGG